jgi:hypothetical protein
MQPEVVDEGHVRLSWSRPVDGEPEIRERDPLAAARLRNPSQEPGSSAHAASQASTAASRRPALHRTTPRCNIDAAESAARSRRPDHGVPTT